MLNLAYLTTFQLQPSAVRDRCSQLTEAAMRAANHGSAITAETCPPVAGETFPDAFTSACERAGQAIHGHADQLAATAASISHYADGVDNQDIVSSNALRGAQWQSQ